MEISWHLSQVRGKKGNLKKSTHFPRKTNSEILKLQTVRPVERYYLLVRLIQMTIGGILCLFQTGWYLSIFLLQASDGLFNDTADFIIEVIDINNNKPVFVFPNETTVLRFNIDVSLFTFILQTQINDCRFFVMTTKIRLGNKVKKYKSCCIIVRTQ